MSDGSKRCGNCTMFNPIKTVKGYSQSSYCNAREHNYYGSLAPGDPMQDTTAKPRQAKLPVTVNSNSKDDCGLFEPDYDKIKTWRKEEEKDRKHRLKEMGI